MARSVIAAVLVTFLAACGDEQPPRKDDPAAWLPPGLSDEAATRATAAFNRGVALMERYEAAEAIPAFEEALLHAPGWLAAEHDLGIAYLNAEREDLYPRAEETLGLVARKVPNDPRPHFALGMLYDHLGRTAEAESRFRRVLEIDPQDPDAHYRLAFLIFERDPKEARRLLERAVAAIPHHEAATYRLFTLLRDAGETERAEALLARFRALKEANAGRPSGMKYGEMGRYAEVVRAFARDGAGAEGPVTFRSASVTALRGEPPSGSGVAVADVDGDGRLEVFFPGLASAFAFSAVGRSSGEETGLDEERPLAVETRDVVTAWFGDMDGDGDPDLFLVRRGPDRLYRNDGGRLVDATEAAGVAGGEADGLAAAWFDADSDGDLDLYVGNDGPNVLWQNDGTGRFTEVAKAAGLDLGDVRTTAVLPFDLDDDRDLDLLLVNDGAPNRVFRNDRVGAWTDVTGEHPAFGAGGHGASLGDMDGDGREDVVIWTGDSPPVLVRQSARGRYEREARFAAVVARLGPVVGGALADLDLDGDPDLVVLSTEDGRPGISWISNRGPAGFVPVAAAAGTETVHGAAAPRDARIRDAKARPSGLVLCDLRDEGALHAVVARAGARPHLWTISPPAGRHRLTVAPLVRRAAEGGRPVPDVVGLAVEVKVGRRIATGRLLGTSGFGGSTPPVVRLGLGEATKADYVRLVWPDGVLQNEIEVAVDTVWSVAKVERKPSSCPVLFAWDGTQFAFVTDFLGVGGVGFFVKRGAGGPVYAPPDPTEDVRIPPEKVAPKDGTYLLRIAEPLEEITWLDEARLVVHEHSSDVEVYPDERFTGSEPWPTGRPIAVREKVFPVAATDETGRDVLDRVRAVDRLTVDVPALPRFVGFAKDHWLQLDFGERAKALPDGARLVLFLDGWVEYTYSHVNCAAGQAGLEMRSPWIEVPDGRGGWRVAVPECGFPAGLPRTMTVDVSSLPLRADGRLRIRTNMQVYWDRAFLGADVGADVVTRTLEASSADLRPLGYPREYSPDGADPTLYDYRRLDVGVPFRAMEGDYTRFGDVRELLRAADERSVVMGRGEEIALAFDATSLPPLAPGRARTLCLHADGWCKDMDLHTAFPDTVEPTPWHGMENYPPREPPPDTPALREYRRTWNTRRVAR
jgi:Flp pilus assembly protein TadD